MKQSIAAARVYLQKSYPLFFIACVCLIAFLSFYHLDVKYVDPWDEAQHGVNAYEMYRDGKIILSTYQYETDYYNLKPPLSMWSIMLSFLAFGTNVFALRFASAFFYVITAVLVGFYMRRFGRLSSILTLMLLAANTTAFAAHMIRAGDADSLYVLLFTIAMLAMLKIKEKTEYIYICGIAFSLAFLTKSFHAGLIAVIGGLFLIITGEIKKLRVKHWILFLVSIAVPILLWAVPRFFIDGTEFFKQMLLVDVLGRTSADFGSNTGPFSYYFSYFFGSMSGKTTVYLCALIICLIGAMMYNHLFTKERYQEVIGYLLWIGIPFLAFSLVSTKLLWYMYPIMIPLFMAAAVFTARIVHDKRIIAAGRITFLAITLFIASYFIKGNITMIQTLPENELQNMIKLSCAEEEVKDMEAYVYLDAENPHEPWAKENLFLIEAYGDCIGKNGGYTAFMEAKEGILFTTMPIYEVLSDKFVNEQIVYETQEYIVLKKY